MSQECHCGCGHSHHDHTHSHGEECARPAGPLTPEMEEFLHHLRHHRFLPVARFLVESSVEEDFSAVALAPVYLRGPKENMDSVKETGAMLTALEEMGYLTLDYGYALSGYPYTEYRTSALYDYFQKTVEEAKRIPDFLGDTPVLELGSIAPAEQEPGSAV
ncbi:hypothetical protein D1159_12695 [Pseudoflavonifractor sp. 524-17]|uniref:hypothetical protein n=1 Tax=Pseudoflavonifractor sp. 524-17 TaxID=2304577 RepID=UPI0013795160|nr:hypothetical protein [Pseudoflavonifractor sp. 524-17]NCE65412.1 hypothetical protein [Pseudoflavonifractor sp. 524-17]